MKTVFRISLCILLFVKIDDSFAQDNLLLNGNFEDINTCTEYNAECGVEGWFYLSNIKVQMLSNDDPELYPWLGNNSFGLLFTWTGYKNFSPIVGTLLPCHLVKDKQYVFRGMFKKPKLNPKLIFWPGVVIGESFYVPLRPFSATMHPDSITQIKYLRKIEYYQFEYRFTATGHEKFLTFGTYITEDTIRSKNTFIGSQSVSIAIDNFSLLPADSAEMDCPNYADIKDAIYNYNYRHKEMDYSLFSKGDLAINLNITNHHDKTEVQPLPPHAKHVRTDTLKLGEVFFDFNKSKLKPEALKMLTNYFASDQNKTTIDSIYIEGHTDSVGTDLRNIQLSKDRCQSVQVWIEQNKVLSADRLQIHPFGESRPVASNRTAQGRAQNRRVELIIFRKETTGTVDSNK